MKRHTPGAWLAPLILALMLDPLRASGQPAAGAPRVDAGDTGWMLVSTALVMLMTPGLALFYGGMVRAKNVLNMLMQSFVAVALVSVLWVLAGYSLAFAPGNAFIGGFGYVGLRGVGLDPNPVYGDTIPHQLYMMYQMMFAIITPALISGAIAERMKFGAYVVFVSLWALVVYCPLAHMVWGSGGLLNTLGALDFAGGTVVHMSSGFSALVLALIVGKRRLDGSDDLRPHNLPMTLIGTALLWFGWFGFNAGSAIHSSGLAVSAFTATHVAAAAAAFTWVAVEWIAYKKPTALGLATGAVAGLVAITPAAGFVGPLPAVLIGAAVSVISFYAIKLKNRFRYDDTLDVFGVHGVGGTWGALATGLFASRAINSAVKHDGLLLGGGFAQLGLQALAAVIALAYAGGVTALLAWVLGRFIGLRVDEDAEIAGLDLALHGETGYSGPDTLLADTGAE